TTSSWGSLSCARKNPSRRAMPSCAPHASTTSGSTRSPKSSRARRASSSGSSTTDVGARAQDVNRNAQQHVRKATGSFSEARSRLGKLEPRYAWFFHASLSRGNDTCHPRRRFFRHESPDLRNGEDEELGALPHGPLA